MEGHTSYINHLVFEPTEGKQIASVSDDHTCRSKPFLCVCLSVSVCVCVSVSVSACVSVCLCLCVCSCVLSF